MISGLKMEKASIVVCWDEDSSEILMNSAYSLEEQQKFRKILDITSFLPGHVWLATSGSRVKKWVGLSKKGLLVSAEAVNKHLQSTVSDKWVQTLPDFHVGGLGVWVRSYLSGASVVNFRRVNQDKWHASSFYKFVQATKGTLTSFVPTQLYDLVQLRLKSPPSLRAVIIGGGALSLDLYHQAVELGWPILPSYGLTECSSQVATAELGSWEIGRFPSLKILSHVQVKLQEEGRISLQSPSLLSVYVMGDEQEEIQLNDPKREGWFISEDKGKMVGEFLEVLGRFDQMIKIGGENVNIAHLENLLQEIRLRLKISQEMTLVAYPDDRLGFAIHLAVAAPIPKHLQFIVEQFQSRVLPFEKIRHIHHVPFIPKSALSKVLQKELLNLIETRF